MSSTIETSPSAEARDAELKTDHLIADVGKRALRGGALTFSAQAAKAVLQITTVIVLTRLLSPAAFGLIAMVASVNAVMEIVRELGLSSATIRKPDVTHAQVTSLFWINTGAASLGALVLFLAAPGIAAFYHQPQLIWVTRALAFAFVMNGVTVQHWALLRRQMRFGAVVTVDMGGEITGFAIAIGLALTGWGYWALVAQRLAGPLFGMVSCWLLCRWRPGLPRFAEGTGELLEYGASVTGVNIMVALARNLDQVLIGWMWGAAPLGLYDRSSRLLMAPVNNFGPPVYAVAMPGFSRIADQPARYRRGFVEMVEKLSMITMPAAVTVAVCAPWVVTLLFGPRWSAATPLVACFATAVVYQPLIQLAGLLFMTQNRMGEMLKVALLDASICIASIAIAVPFGANWVAGAIAASGLTMRLPVQFWFASAKGPVTFGDLVRAVIPSAIAAGAVALMVMLMRGALAASTPPIAGVALASLTASVTGFAVYIAIPKSRRSLREFRGLARKLKGSGSEPAAALGG